MEPLQIPTILVTPWLNSRSIPHQVQLQCCTPGIWSRFNVCASRVKTFIYGANMLQQNRKPSVHFSSFSALIMLRGTLLPRLTTLLVPTFSHDSLALYFASSSLPRLEVGSISTTSAMHALEVFWMTIKSRMEGDSPSLRHLSVGSAVPPAVLGAVLSPQVQSVKVVQPFPGSLETLASLTNLQKLEIWKVPRNMTNIKFSAPQLKQISLQGSLPRIRHFTAARIQGEYGASDGTKSLRALPTEEGTVTQKMSFVDYFQPFFWDEVTFIPRPEFL
ncbi:hypothetical protein BDN72DRAFT_963059 [Pluteus cervinus]|uniref:Uncharacterized protein n=1 Tax=Pluteus cervinus TaxID=181527 RepID=A0ACD3AHA7_9AGAR|nr:hypothetical protein BDN72DRAFT_963059 [Pluteus cervinus]